jgi:hypothetical protein
MRFLDGQPPERESMKFLVCAIVLTVSVSESASQGLKGTERTYVDPARKASIVLEFDDKLTRIPTEGKVALANGSGEKVYCSGIQAKSGIPFVTFIFDINSADFSMFEKLVSDSTGYFLLNDEPIEFSGGNIPAGALQELTRNRIGTILEDDWKRYILNEYASEFLYPHHFKVGTRLGIQDSTRTVYFLELVQSGNWVDNTSISVFWGVKGRWSTDTEDRLNNVQFYPVTLLMSKASWRVALSTGVETGYQGFGKLGRGTLKGEFQFRLPFNPIDLTLSCPRWRINPVVTFSLQGNLGWANERLPNSVRNGLDASVQVRYDIPVANSYYLQTYTKWNYSTVTKEVQYQYEFSLGYIIEGSVRVMAAYKQGFQDVSYQFDKQLLLGFAFDVLNISRGK